MPKKEQKEGVKCPGCGHESPPESKVCPNCSEQLPSEPEASPGSGVQELMSVPGIGDAKAHVLYKAGYKTVKDLQEADPEELAGVKGIGDKLAAKIIEGAQSAPKPTNEGLAGWLSGRDDGLSDWLSGREETAKQEAPAQEEMAYDETLAKWLSGSEEGLDSWLQETVAAKQEVRTGPPPEVIIEHEAELAKLRESLRDLLKKYEGEAFDPGAVVEELAKARAEVEAEAGRRKRLEEELENVKRGSIAVIKFIKKQQGGTADAMSLADQLASEMSIRENLELKVMELETLVAGLREKAERSTAAMPPEAQVLRRQELELTEKKAKVDALEHQLRAKEEALKEGLISYGQLPPVLGGSSVEQVEAAADKEKAMMDEIHALQAKLSQSEMDLKHMEEKLDIVESGRKDVDPELTKKLDLAQGLEKSVGIRDQEIQRLKEELRIREDEMTKLKEPLAYKEQEMNRREDDLMYRERLLQEELKRVAQQKLDMGSGDEITLKKRLEELQGQITQKEEEVRNKEKYLSMKEEDLRAREQGLIGEEIEKREQDRLLELKQEKVKTGTSRLDDLLLGGIPFGSNVLIYGPPFTGKEVLMNSFIADGLKKGVPAIWVITEKSAKEVRDEMMFVISGYEEYEKRGLVRYIDTYSRSMGDESKDEYTEYVEAPTDYESIQKAIETTAKEFLSKHEYYRLAFRSISTLIAYLDPNTAFRFLSPVVGRRKRDKAVSMYTIEKGVHGEQEIQMLGSLMDGMIEFKLENLNTFMSVKGICEVQSRAFIRYSATKSGLNIGSFSLDHIR